MSTRKKFVLLIFLLIANLHAQSLNRTFDEALKLFEGKNYTSAYELFKTILTDNSTDSNEKSSAHYYAAECLVKLNQLDGAAAEFESFLKLYPLSSFRESVLYELGTIYYHNDEYRKARENLTALIYEYPESAFIGSAYYWIGESYSAQNKFIDAEENLKEAISRRDENNFITHSIYALGQLYEKTGDYNNAVAHYDELLTYYKNSPLAPRAQLRIGVCYFILKDYDSAVLELTDPQINNLSREEIVEAKYFLANAFVRLRDYKNATTIFEELLSDNYDSALTNKINYSLAWIKFQKNEFNEAFKIFDELSRVENDTIAIASLFWSGECKRYLGESVQANEIYDLFIKKYPSHPYAARAQLGKGTSYYSQNLSQEAESSLLRAVNSNDLYARGKAFALLGELKLNQKLFSEARSNFQEAVKLTSNYPDIYNRTLLGLGVSEFFLSNYDDALRNLELLKNRSRDFESDKTNFYLAESYLMRGEYSAAIKHYNQVSPSNDELRKPVIYGKAYAYFNLKDFPNAIYYFNDYVTKYRTDQNVNDAKLRLADSYFGIKSFDKASQIYRELFTNDILISNDDQTYYQYSQSLFKAGRSNDAIEEFIKLQQKFPRSKFADASQYVVGWIYFQQNNFRAAIENYEKLLTRYPSSSLKPIAYYSIGDSYFNLGDYEESINYYNRVLTEFPNTPYILDAVNGIQYAYLAKDQPDRAVSFIDQFVSSNPSSKFSDQIFFKKGDIFYSSDDYNNAMIAYQEFISRYPSSQLIPNAYYWIGKSAAFLKREAEAIDNFNRVLSINLRSTIGISAAIDLANIYTNKNDFSSAIRVLNSSIDAQPTSNQVPELLYLRAVAEIKSINLEEAYKTLDQIVTYYEGSVFAAKAKIELSVLEIDRKNFDNALILLKELAEKRLDDIGARAQYLIGLTYYEQNNMNDAIIAFVRVRSVFSGYDEWFTKSLLKLGDCYVKLNDKQQAREMYRAVINRHKTGELAQEANRKLKQL
jgi:TolA-binding protein